MLPLRMKPARNILTVGSFDGVHLGHRALIDAARRQADRTGGSVIALVFERHPLATLRPEDAPPPLTLPETRRELLRAAGVDQIVGLDPTPELLSLDPQAFIERMVQAHHPAVWIEGPDFRFGRDRAGNLDVLRDLGKAHGFDVQVIDPVETVLHDLSQVPVRSSLIRWLVLQGRVADAAKCLGRPYAVRGVVVRGEQRGRTIGFPTANLDTGAVLLPADGVYAGVVEHDGRPIAAAISLGTKPTFAGHDRAFEAHLIDFDGDLYGETLEVTVTRFVRDQVAFASREALIEQMHRDVARCVAAAQSV